MHGGVFGSSSRRSESRSSERTSEGFTARLPRRQAGGDRTVPRLFAGSGRQNATGTLRDGLAAARRTVVCRPRARLSVVDQPEELRGPTQRRRLEESRQRRAAWLNLVYGHNFDRPQPEKARRILEEHPTLFADNLLLSCATGDYASVTAALRQNPAIVDRVFDAWKCPSCNWTGYAMPPLAAVTHSSLLRLDAFRDQLHHTARVLLTREPISISRRAPRRTSR